MQYCFDRRCWRRRVQQCQPQLTHHLRIAQLVELAQALQIIKVYGWKTRGFYRLKVPSRPFNIERLYRLAEYGNTQPFERRIATTV